MPKTVCKVIFVDLNGGCWGLIDTDGQEWRPVVFPEELKVEGMQVSCTFEVSDDDDFSVFMWGTPIHLISFAPISY